MVLYKLTQSLEIVIVQMRWFSGRIKHMRLKYNSSNQNNMTRQNRLLMIVTKSDLM
ncbi:ORF078 [Staphylococcus phage 37]|uniref:ORF078 n=1 Tax=Staphylococcus phage 37 TaxID=2936813 RepID=Q4ZCC4_9CAUD|nr:ORF078 [Staphylococcus phage 37]AAX91324.1 ORF078 [Staphylococcus phage 37]